MLVEGILGDPWSSTGPMAGLSWLVLLSPPFNSEGMIIVALIVFEILLLLPMLERCQQIQQAAKTFSERLTAHIS